MARVCFWPDGVAWDDKNGWIVGWWRDEACRSCVVAAVVSATAVGQSALAEELRSGGVLGAPVVLGACGSSPQRSSGLRADAAGVHVDTLVSYARPDCGRCHAWALRPCEEELHSVVGDAVQWMNAAYIVERQLRVRYAARAPADAAASQLARSGFDACVGDVASMRAAMRSLRGARTQRLVAATRAAMWAARAAALAVAWTRRAALVAALRCIAVGANDAAALLRGALAATAAGAPFDIKLNEPVARAVGSIALPCFDAYVAGLRWAAHNAPPSRIVLAAIVITACGGVPLLAACALAAVRALSLPWRGFCQCYLTLYRQYVGLLQTLARLFIGLKFNVLRERVDSYVAPDSGSGLSELLVGTGVFVGLACLFPTLSAFALTLAVVRFGVDALCVALRLAAASSAGLPFAMREVLGRALNPRAHAGGVRFRVVEDGGGGGDGRALRLRVVDVYTPACEALGRGWRDARARARGYDWLLQ